MLALGPAKKVTIHLNEDTSSRSDFLSHEILSLLLKQGVAGASVLRPEAGFDGHLVKPIDLDALEEFLTRASRAPRRLPET